MKRFSLRTLLIACVAMALLIGYFRRPLIRLVRTNQLPYQLIESQEDLDQMLGKERAFVFVHADWSLSSVFAKRAVDDFAVNWTWNNRSPSVSFYLIDQTGKLGPWFFKWAKSDNDLEPIIHGNGEAVWIRDGTVLHVLRPQPGQSSEDDLKKLTKELFEHRTFTRP